MTTATRFENHTYIQTTQKVVKLAGNCATIMYNGGEKVYNNVGMVLDIDYLLPNKRKKRRLLKLEHGICQMFLECYASDLVEVYVGIGDKVSARKYEIKHHLFKAVRKDNNIIVKDVYTNETVISISLDNIKNPQIKGYLNKGVYELFLKYTKEYDNEIPSFIKPSSSTVVNKLKDYPQYKVYEEQLLKYYQQVSIRTTAVDESVQLLHTLIESHNLMSKFIKTDIYPKITNLGIAKGKGQTYAYFRWLYEKDCFLTSVGINLGDTSKIADERYNNHYWHEYGHFLYHYYTRESQHKQYNNNIYKQMEKELRQTTYVKQLQSLKRQHKIEVSHLNYLLGSEELIADIFSSYIIHKANIPMKDLPIYKQRLFSQEDLSIFIKYMGQLKL